MQPGIDNQPIPLRYIDLAFQIADVVLHTVEANLGQIDIRVNADTAHRHQLTDLDSCLNIQLMRRVLEYLQNALIVCAFRRSCQAQRERRLEVSQYLLIGIRRCVVSFIDDQIIEIIIFEGIQMQRYALNAAADDMRIGFFEALHVPAYRLLRPQTRKGCSCLIHQLLRVCKE